MRPGPAIGTFEQTDRPAHVRRWKARADQLLNR